MIYDQKVYTLYANQHSLNVIFKNNEYDIDRDIVDNIIAYINNKEIPFAMSPSNIDRIISNINSMIDYGVVMEFVKPKVKSVYKENIVEKSDNDDYSLAKQSFMNSLVDDFEITNVHDQKFIWNKMSNQYKHYDGKIDSFRVCYSNENGEYDKLYRHIKKYQKQWNSYDRLYYNDVTGKYIMIGFGYGGMI